MSKKLRVKIGPRYYNLKPLSRYDDGIVFILAECPSRYDRTDLVREQYTLRTFSGGSWALEAPSYILDRDDKRLVANSLISWATDVARRA